MADHGFKIVLGNHDIRDVGIRYQKFNSEKKLLKIFAQGTGQVTLNNDGAGFDVQINAHDLGYAPQYIIYSQYYDVNTGLKVSEYIRVPYHLSLVGGAVYAVITPVNSSTELRLQGSSYDGLGGSYILLYSYIIYYNPED